MTAEVPTQLPTSIHIGPENAQDFPGVTRTFEVHSLPDLNGVVPFPVRIVVDKLLQPGETAADQIRHINGDVLGYVSRLVTDPSVDLQVVTVVSVDDDVAYTYDGTYWNSTEGGKWIRYGGHHDSSYFPSRSGSGNW